MKSWERRQFLTTAAAVGASSLYRPVMGAAKPDPIKYLQIGTAHAHANKIEVYKASPDWEVVGVVEPDPSRVEAAKASKLYGDLPFYSLEDGLNLEGLQVVGIETEVKDLLTYAEKAVDAGYHLHLDKPAGESFSHFKKIYEKAESQNLTIQMGYMYRFNPAVVFMRDCLKKGWLGEPFEVHTVMSKVVPPAGRAGLDDYDGGIMFELGCHIVDLTVGMLGKPDAIKAFPRRVIENDSDSLIDNMMAVYEYPKATATVRSTAVEVEGFARRHFVLCGTEGTCHIQPLDRPTMRLALSKPQDGYKKGYQELKFSPPEVPGFGPYKRYVGDAADLAKIVRGEKESDWGMEHDLAVQDAVLRSAGLEPG